MYVYIYNTIWSQNVIELCSLLNSKLKKILIKVATQINYLLD